MQIRVEQGLPFVSVTVTHGGHSLELDRVLLDTGSARCVFAVDQLQLIGVQYEPQDAVHRIRGVGGAEFVFTKRVDRLTLGELDAEDFEIEAGTMDYGFELSTVLRSRFFIVSCEAIKVFSAADLTYVDILLAMALRLFQQATDAGILSRRRELIDKTLLKDVYRWFSQEIINEKISEPIPETELSATVNLAIIKLKGRISREAPTRRVVRERVEHRLSDLLDKMNEVLDDIARNAHKRVLIILEDTDKLDLATARELFQDHANSLTTPHAHIIYTFPIALRNMNDFPQIRNNFSQRFILPNIRIHHRDGTPDEPGRDLLRELVWRRMDRSLIEAEALDLAVEMSGGLPRTLVLLVRGAAASARSQGLDKIAMPNMARAITELRDDYQAVLTPEHYATLHKYRKQPLMNEDAVREVLHNLSLLEYANDERWCDVHPIVEQLLQRAVDAQGSADGST